MEPLSLQLPASFIDALAERAAALVAAGLEERLEYLDTAQAAAYLGWARKRIDNLSAQGRIPFRQDCEGGKRTYIRQELDALMQGLGGVSLVDALAKR